MAAKLRLREATLQQEIKSLRQRISFLERAIKPKLQSREALQAIGKSRDRAEHDATHAALKEYFEQERIKRLTNYPALLESDVKMELDEAEFLRSRGLKPRPSEIPKALRQRAAQIKRTYMRAKR